MMYVGSIVAMTLVLPGIRWAFISAFSKGVASIDAIQTQLLAGMMAVAGTIAVMSMRVSRII
ncbi:MAG: hypothetical protein GZ085_05555 [Sulfuriferula multivorans]|uniref:Uncharacterized protein n=1 Tax=Sulfuriferula multivorans TaxID=1559896 RepID=A0A7C9KAG8_9PROT|nr:hypothetical protein [Sulfuriferula multivorans]